MEALKLTAMTHGQEETRWINFHFIATQLADHSVLLCGTDVQSLHVVVAHLSSWRFLFRWTLPPFCDRCSADRTEVKHVTTGYGKVFNPLF